MGLGPKAIMRIQNRILPSPANIGKSGHVPWFQERGKCKLFYVQDQGYFVSIFSLSKRKLVTNTV